VKTQQLWKYVLKKFIRELKFEGKKMILLMKNAFFEKN
jgi:hypothetical protein